MRNQRENDTSSNNPTAFDFVGADCFEPEWDWTVIKTVVNITWSHSDEEKAWNIEKKDRRRFSCFGFVFKAVTTKDPCCQRVAVQDVKMWKESGDT